MRIVLYETEIPQNMGTLLRTAACLGFGVDIIEPCGFPISDRRLKRAAMDYVQQVDYRIYPSYQDYLQAHPPKRLLLLSTNGAVAYDTFAYHATDSLMLGRESCGVPAAVEEAIPHRLLIPMQPGCRSLNVAIAGGIVMGEMRRQLGYPG